MADTTIDPPWLSQTDAPRHPDAAARPGLSGPRAWLAGLPARGLLLVAAATVLAASAGQLLLDETALRLGWHAWLLQDGFDDRGSIGLALVFGMLATRHVVWRGRPSSSTPCPLQTQRAVAMLAAQPAACAGLVRLGDKAVLFSECGTAFIMYARTGRSLVALFDPVGDRAAWPDLVAAFCALARNQRRRPVFYQVSADFLPYAVDMGMQSVKLGEQAIVDLAAFDTRGGQWLKLRRSINRAERDGLQFSMLTGAQVVEAMDELAGVSEAWLAQHKAAEKGFSLGTFKRDYVGGGAVAVLRLEGRIVAFASVLTAQAGGDAFIDLMRHLPGTHRGMMDLLFVRTMEHLKADGFRSLDLGMAPLSGLSSHTQASLWNRIGRQVYRHGERYYNFQGVRTFKAKFDPRWQPRYLVSRGAFLPVAALFDVTLLIGGGLRGVLRR